VNVCSGEYINKVLHQNGVALVTYSKEYCIPAYIIPIVVVTPNSSSRSLIPVQTHFTVTMLLCEYS